MLKRLKAALAAALMIFASLFARGFNASAAGMSYTPTEQYASSKYYQRLKSVGLTGDKRFDMVNIASTQIGYHEGDQASELNGKNVSGSKNYSEFGYWFGTRVMGNDEGMFTAWCAFFISWCARQAGISEYVICNAAYAKPDGAASRGFGYFHVDAIDPAGYTPQCGDLIFIDWDADDTWDHVGIVYYTDGNKVGTIEGNAEDCVRHRQYDMADPVIRAYGTPNYGERSQAAAEVLKAKGKTQWAIISSARATAAIISPAGE